jgi:hypothetical protein
MKKLFFALIILVGCSKESAYKNDIKGQWIQVQETSAKFPNNYIMECQKDDIWEFTDSLFIMDYQGVKCQSYEPDMIKSNFKITQDTLTINDFYPINQYIINSIKGNEMNLIRYRYLNGGSFIKDTIYMMFQRK